MSSSKFGLNRRQMVIAAACLVAGCATARPAPAPRRILFVCEHGSVKSPIAREHFRRIAARRGIKILADSRGIHPQEDVSPALAAALSAERIDPKRDPLTALSRADLAAADIVVTFNPIPPAMTAGAVRDLRYWDDVPTMNDDYPAARTRLLLRLEALLDELDAMRR